eukprot:TRINITY_DN80193_c0_g1_i1.p1 TRINITY_DN80193_c0_g1~~TRINITY_DN80193_c0_g1_i1.p1  ORF type:complete len:162 (+),score=20.89 TRINITY_DN80193_c0_g1_i1:225-710(+)
MEGEGKRTDGAMFTSVPMVLRVLEICFCIASFTTMTFMNIDYQHVNATCFVFGTTITGLIVSFFMLLLILVAKNKPDMMVDTIRIQLYSSFMMLLLIFAASSTGSAFRTNACGTYYSGGGLLSLIGDDCTLLAWSVAMSFLASFTYIGSFWHFFFLLANNA